MAQIMYMLLRKTAFLQFDDPLIFCQKSKDLMQMLQMFNI
jgi:hypothetical protein